LACNLDDFTISSVTEYTSKNKQPKPMSDSLVPIIYKEQGLSTILCKLTFLMNVGCHTISEMDGQL
jgi:hypothetical protein